MRIRMQVFTKQFMEQFDQEHAEAFGPGTKAPDAGFPDTGCGRFSKKLPYADWFKKTEFGIMLTYRSLQLIWYQSCYKCKC